MRFIRNIFIIVFLLLINLQLFAVSQTISINNDLNQISTKTFGEFTQITYKSNYFTFKNIIPGYPELPIIKYQIIIPTEKSVSHVEILSCSESELIGNFLLYPSQKSFSINESEGFTDPDTQIYQTNEKYPSQIVKHVHTGNFAGHRIASFLIYPMRYNPVKQKLYFYDEIVFQITYSYNNKALVKPERLFQFDIDRINKVIKKMVENPEDILANKPYIEEQKLDQGIEVTNAPSAQGLGVRYLIITSDALANSFESLKEWKNKTGVTAEIRSLEWIKANVNPGVDDAETIRNFIKWAYQKWGTQYVLLGGDADIIPTRFVFTNDLTVSTDMYYSDLDGN